MSLCFFRFRTAVTDGTDLSMRKRMMKTTLLRPQIAIGFGVLLCVLIAAVPALADDDLVEVSEGQLDLNESGIEAVTNGDYDQAIRLFEASLDLGELNVTYTNLARAYQHDGQCEKAEKYYNEALEAPQAEEPTPDQIEVAIEHYRAEMADRCPGYLEVECRPGEMALFIDGEGPTQCRAD